MTPNIDNLEEKAGLDMSKVCQAHGAARGAACTKGHDNDEKAMFESIKNDKVYYCTKDNCNKPVKPDIVFFGEALPESFFQAVNDLQGVDLVIVMGTALAVSPFKDIVSMFDKNVPQVLFNMTNVFETSGYDFDKP